MAGCRRSFCPSRQLFRYFSKPSGLFLRFFSYLWAAELRLPNTNSMRKANAIKYKVHDILLAFRCYSILWILCDRNARGRMDCPWRPQTFDKHDGTNWHLSHLYIVWYSDTQYVVSVVRSSADLAPTKRNMNAQGYCRRIWYRLMKTTSTFVGLLVQSSWLILRW